MADAGASAVAGSGRKLAVIGPLAVLVAMGQGTLSLGLVFFARDALGASKAETGLLAGIWPLFYMASCHLSRPLTKRLRPRFCVLGATLSLAVLTMLLAQVRSLAPAFALNALLGMTTALFWPPMMGWLATNAEGAHLSRRLGIFNLCWSGGAIVSPTLAGRASELSARLPILLSSGLFLLAALTILGAILALPGIRSDDDAHQREGDPGATVSRGTPLRFSAWVGVFSTYLVLGVVLNVFPMAGRADLGLRAGQVGDLLFWRAIATSVALGLLGRMKWWHFQGWQMVVGTLALGVAVADLALACTPGPLAIALILGGIFVALNYVNSLFHGAAGSSHRGVRMAIHESLLSAGLCIGASLGGIVYQHLGSTQLLLGCAGVMGLTAMVQLVLVRWRTQTSG